MGPRLTMQPPPVISIAHHQRHGEIGGDPVFTWIFSPSIWSWEEAMNDARLKCLTQIRRAILWRILCLVLLASACFVKLFPHNSFIN